MKDALKKHKKKLIIGAMILVIVIIAIVVITNFFGKRRSMRNFFAPTESTMVLSKMDLVSSISATGTIESAKSKTVSANINGVEVDEVKVKVGDTVKKGDVLVVFDETDLQETLEEAQENLSDTASDANDNIEDAKEQLEEAQQNYTEQKAELAEDVSDAKAKMKTAKENLASVKKKVKNNKATSEQLVKAEEEYNQAQSAYEQAVSSQKNSNKQNQSSIDNAQDALEKVQKEKTKNVKNANKQVEEAQENLDKCTIIAPISGVVTALNVEEGDTYSGGDVVQIDDLSSFTVTTSVDEYDISDVKVGQRVVILTEATGDDELEGEITYVALTTGSSSMSEGSMGSTSSGYAVEIDINTKDDRLRMGLTAKCSIVLKEATDVYAVPYDAVHTDEQGNSVIYVSNKTAQDFGQEQETEEETTATEDSYNKVIVTVGMESEYYVEISGDGLSEGMMVIIPTDEVDSTNSDNEEKGMFGGFGGGMPSGNFEGMQDGGSRGNFGGNRSGGGMPSGRPQ